MKIRITQAGFKGFNGQMGAMFFKEGMSENDVIPRDAVRLSSVMACEWEDGAAINPAQVLLNSMDVTAPVMREPVDEKREEKLAPREAPAPTVTYTEEELSKIADEKGIAGIRDIAAPLGIKGKSIQDLIAAVLKAAPAPKTE